MSATVIAVELGIMFLVFGFLAFGMLLINPLAFVGEYPPEIQEAYYRSQCCYHCVYVYICMDVTYCRCKNICPRCIVSLLLCDGIGCVGYFLY